MRDLLTRTGRLAIVAGACLFVAGCGGGGDATNDAAMNAMDGNLMLDEPANDASAMESAVNATEPAGTDAGNEADTQRRARRHRRRRHRRQHGREQRQRDVTFILGQPRGCIRSRDGRSCIAGATDVGGRDRAGRGRLLSVQRVGGETNEEARKLTAEAARARRACAAGSGRGVAGRGAGLPLRPRLSIRPDRGQRPAGRPAAARAPRRPNIARTCSGTCAPASTSPRCNASSRPICGRSTIITRSSPTIRASWPAPTVRSKAISGGSTARNGPRRFDDYSTQTYNNFSTLQAPARLLPDRVADQPRKRLPRRKGDFNQLATARMRELRNSLTPSYEAYAFTRAPIRLAPISLIPDCTAADRPRQAECERACATDRAPGE